MLVHVIDRATQATPDKEKQTSQGAIAQLGEHLLCKQGVVGSIPTGSTFFWVFEQFYREQS